LRFERGATGPEQQRKCTANHRFDRSRHSITLCRCLFWNGLGYQIRRRDIIRPTMKHHLLLTAALLLSPLVCRHATAEQDDHDTPPTLAALARSADVIALAQVRDTDYRRQREIPVSGSAYLQVLIRYRGEPGMDVIEVYEKGLHEHECYFPDPTVMEEGRRYLLFLRRDRNEPQRFRGLPEGCAVDVLVDQENRYAVRLPVTGLAFSDRLEELAQDMEFSDPYAVVDDAALPPALRRSMEVAGQIVPHDVEPSSRRWRYTQGVSLGRFRELLQLDSP